MSLSLWYKMNEDDSLIGTDSSDTPITSTTNSGVVSYSDSTYGDVAYFDGSSSLTLAEAATPADFEYGASRAYSFWFKQPVQNNGTLISAGKSSDYGRRFKFDLVGTSGMNLFLYELDDFTTTTVLSIDTWYHIVLMNNSVGDVLDLYINGVLDVTGSRDVRTLPSNIVFFGSVEAYVSDFRGYEGVLTPQEILDIYTMGPDIYSLDATLYTHLVDLSWGARSNVSSYRLTQTEDGGGEQTILDNTTELSFTAININPGISYEFKLYSDMDLVTPYAIVTESTPIADTSNIQTLLARISNDLTVLSDSTVLNLDSILRDILTTGDIIQVDVGRVVFVGDSETVSLPESYAAYKILTPFQVTAGSGQEISVVLPSSTTETIAYNDATNEVISNAVSYSVGDHFLLETFKVNVVSSGV